jgi:hypothetical protein
VIKDAFQSHFSLFYPAWIDEARKFVLDMNISPLFIVVVYNNNASPKKNEVKCSDIFMNEYETFVRDPSKMVTELD